MALKAGVCASTVSNYLNNTAPVNKKTVEKIAKAIKELNYTANIIARGLRSGKTKLVGVIFPDIYNIFYAALINGITEVAEKHGYTIILACNNYNFNVELEQLNNLINSYVDGFIFCSGGIDIKEILKVKKKGFSVVTVDRITEDKDLCSVEVDNYKAVYNGIKYLIENGHKNIYYMTETLSMGTLENRLMGYKDALTDYGIKIDDSKIIINKELQVKKMQKSYEIFNDLINSNRIEKPAALFSTSDYIAIGALKAALDNNFKVPDDISFIGYDNIFFSNFIKPSLTSIKQPKKEMGKAAMKALIDLIEGRKVKKKKIIFDTELVIRETVRNLNQ